MRLIIVRLVCLIVSQQEGVAARCPFNEHVYPFFCLRLLATVWDDLDVCKVITQRADSIVEIQDRMVCDQLPVFDGDILDIFHNDLLLNDSLKLLDLITNVVEGYPILQLSVRFRLGQVFGIRFL